jgi:hypothetical protein
MGFVFRAFLASFLAALVVHARLSSPYSLSLYASLPRMVVGNFDEVLSFAVSDAVALRSGF